MPHSRDDRKKSFFAHLLAPFQGSASLFEERSRLEAFLNAFPGEYCGFHADGSVIYSNGFCALFNLPTVTCVEDVQASLKTGDSAALEGQYAQLETAGKPFTITVHLSDATKTVRLKGAIGVSNDSSDKFFILWAEDISDEASAGQKMKLAREAAEKQMSLFQNALENLPFASWIRDASCDLSWVNKAYADLLGTVRSDVCAGQLEILLSQKDYPVRDMAQDALKTGKAQLKVAHVIVHGSRKAMEICESPLPGTNCTIGYALDKTAEEENQAQLDRHRNATKSLLEHLHSAIAFFSSSQQIEFYNPSFSALWHLDEQWLNTKPKLGDILEKLREARQLPEQADFRKYKQGWLDMFSRLIDPHEDMLYRPDGGAVRLMVIPHPMGGLMMIFEDVTSRLELESSYNTLMAVQSETLDNLAEGVVVYGSDGRLKLWNPAFLKIWDLPETIDPGQHISLVVRHMAGFFPPEQWETSIQTMLTEHGLERTAQEGQLVRNDGTYIRYATIPLPDGGVMVSYYDVTDAARIEKALRDKNDALETAEQLKTDFLANVSYQLRTPLNAIMGFAEILNHKFFGPLNDRQHEYTSGIYESGARLVSLIDDILDLSSIEAGYFELTKDAVAVKPMLDGLQSIVSDWAGKRGLTVRFICPADVGMVKADERRLKQAFLKIFQNAINFTPEKGSVILEAAKLGEKIIFTLADTGVGIDETHLRTIFEPFDKNSSSPNQRNNSGAGLGLALVKKIVELHDGSIEIESKKNVGTIVKVTIPSVVN